MNNWQLAWNHGQVTVQPLGGMVDVEFLLPSGKIVSPMYRAPWIGEQIGVASVETMPAMLQRLRGDWFCVPFGAGHSVPGLTPRWKDVGEPEAGGLMDGYGFHHNWSILRMSQSEMTVTIEYPQNHPIKRLERTIRPMPGESGVRFDLSVEARDNVSLPIGLHPTFRLPAEPGTLRLQPGGFSFGLTYPGDFEPGAFMLKHDSLFDSIKEVGTRDLNRIDLSRLPLVGDSETLVQLCGVDGRFDLINEKEKYAVRVEWIPEHFPSCAIWISNRGRKSAPWNGRNLAVGIEPVCSAFELGTAISKQTNPISESGFATCVSFKAEQVWRTQYSIRAVKA
jgi:hypothetical protein